MSRVSFWLLAVLPAAALFASSGGLVSAPEQAVAQVKPVKPNPALAPIPAWAGTGPKANNRTMDLRFTAPAGVNCSKLLLIQTVMAQVETEDAMGRPKPGLITLRAGEILPLHGPLENGWGVDVVEGEIDPYYNGDDSGLAATQDINGGFEVGVQGNRAGDAVTPSSSDDAPEVTETGFERIQERLGRRDSPVTNRVRQVILSFETAAFCAGSRDTGNFLGSITWQYVQARKLAGDTPDEGRRRSDASRQSWLTSEGTSALGGASLNLQKAVAAWVGERNMARRKPIPLPLQLLEPPVACVAVPPPYRANEYRTWKCTVTNTAVKKAYDLHLKFDRPIRLVPDLGGWARFRIDNFDRDEENPCRTFDRKMLPRRYRPDDTQVRLDGSTDRGKQVKSVQPRESSTIQVRSCTEAKTLNVIGINWVGSSRPVMSLDVKSPGVAYSDPGKTNRVGDCQAVAKEASCDVEVGSSFSLGVEINNIGLALPDKNKNGRAGYTGIFTAVRLPAGIRYKRRQFSDEIIWPQGTSLTFSRTETGDGNLVSHEARGTESVYVGNVVVAVYTCRTLGNHKVSLPADQNGVFDENGVRVPAAEFTQGGVNVGAATITINCVAPTPPPPEDCGDGIDNDGDGLIDSADPDCPVGGIAVFPDVGGSSPPGAGLLATIIAGATAGAIALVGAAWYARRRWLA